MKFHIDSFSGSASELKGKNRTCENVLAALRRDPKLSTWDLSEHPWLVSIVSALKQGGHITEAPSAFPWLRYCVEAPAIPLNKSTACNSNGTAE